MADLSIKYGQQLMKRYHAYRDADDKIAELILRVESCWIKTEIQIEFLKSNWDSLGPKFQAHQTSILDKLQAKLLVFDRELDRVLSQEPDEIDHAKKYKLKRAKFALGLKTCLETAVNELESWRERFDPSWWLLLRLKDPAIDQNLASSSSGKASLMILKSLRDEISTQENEVTPRVFQFVEDSALCTEHTDIEGSQSTIACVRDTQNYVIVDKIICDSYMDPELTMKDVQDLARILAKVEPTRFGLLLCCGVVKHQESWQNSPRAYDLLFSTPLHLANPRSLRAILSSSSDFALNERVNLAVSLAKAVLFLHASHFVHKSLRPENIILFSDSDEKLGTPFLVGFERFRLDTTQTHRYGDDHWERNLYRHPQRYGIRPQDDFTMQHDVYSLGVVLLELGIGVSFVHWPKETANSDRPTPEAQLETLDLTTSKKKFGQAMKIKSHLVALAKAKLPRTFGRKYTEAVLACLTCLDQDNATFGEMRDTQDDDGMLVGVNYIEKVNLPVRQFCMRSALTRKDPLCSQ
ncbi:hypothetical protein ACLMJK_009090 [Lecanora helva]